MVELTKREYIAIEIMKAMINTGEKPQNRNEINNFAHNCYTMADAMIKETK